MDSIRRAMTALALAALVAGCSIQPKESYLVGDWVAIGGQQWGMPYAEIHYRVDGPSYWTLGHSDAALVVGLDDFTIVDDDFTLRVLPPVIGFDGEEPLDEELIHGDEQVILVGTFYADWYLETRLVEESDEPGDDVVLWFVRDDALAAMQRNAEQAERQYLDWLANQNDERAD